MPKTIKNTLIENTNLIKPRGLKTELNYEYVKELERFIPVIDSVLSPSKSISTKLFLNLISKLGSELKGKRVLDLGCGTGVLSIALARAGAKVTAVDISPFAVKNTILTSLLEKEEVKKRIRTGESDLYSNLNEILLEEDYNFDFIFFNNPLIASEIYKDEDYSGNTGLNFETPIRALNSLPKVLNTNGRAYMLTTCIEEKGGIINQIRSICGYKKLSEVYWTTSTAKEICSYIEPGLVLNETKFTQRASNEPLIDYKIVSIKIA